MREYKIISSSSKDDLEQAMNQLAKDGWQLTTFKIKISEDYTTTLGLAIMERFTLEGQKRTSP